MRVPVPGAGLDRDRDPMRRLAGLAIAAALLLPPALAEGGPVLCPIRRATGLPCPTCGLTRSWVAALHGRPGASLRFHPLGILALAATAAYAARADERGGLIRGSADDRLVPGRLGHAGPVLVVGWLVVWLARVGAEMRRRERTPRP